MKDELKSDYLIQAEKAVMWIRGIKLQLTSMSQEVSLALIIIAVCQVVQTCRGCE